MNTQPEQKKILKLRSSFLLDIQIE